GKNPGQLEPLEVPEMSDPAYSTFLATVFQRTKDSLNQMTEAQKEAMEEQQWFRAALPNVDDVDGINSLLERAKNGGAICKGLLHERAKELDLHFDKALGAYVEAVREAAE